MDKKYIERPEKKTNGTKQGEKRQKYVRVNIPKKYETFLKKVFLKAE